MTRALVALALVALAGGCHDAGADGSRRTTAASTAAPAESGAARLVVAGGTVTEIVYALGLGEGIVAIDTSSTFPPDALQTKATIGYQRTLAAEGILAQRPSLVLLSADAGPPATLEQLRGAGLRLEIVGGGYDLAGAEERIQAVARALGVEAKGTDLVAKLRREQEAARALVARATSRPRTLFVYARGPGTLMVGGRKTPADAMLTLAGATNAIEGFDGFRPLTAEAVSAAAPDVILLPARGLESIGGVEGVLAQPGLAATPAGVARRIVTVDDLLLLGFGPRLGQAVDVLARRLHPELAERP